MVKLTSRAIVTDVHRYALSTARMQSVLCVGLALLLVHACSSSDDSPNSDGGAVYAEKLITPETGGSVELDDGSKLVIPPSALPAGAPVNISVGLGEDTATPDDAVSPIWVFGPAGTKFSKPVDIELPFELGDRDAARYVIAWTKAGSDTDFEDMVTTFANGKAKTQVTHFSLGAIRELPVAVPLDCDASTSSGVDTNGDQVVDFCRCKSGFSTLGGKCVDIDECGANNGGCNSLVSCTNTAGSFTCGDCPVGFLGGGLDGCNDVDECATANGGCDSHVTCLNMPGSFSCGDCPTGFTGSGDTVCTAVADSTKAINSFLLAGVAGVINPDTGVITVTVPYKATLASLMPTVEYVGKSITPTALQDFTKPVVYTVTGADGSTKDYTVMVTRAAASAAKLISSFKINDVEGVFGGIDGKTITVTLPFGTLTLDGLVPTIIHDGTVAAEGLSNGAINFVESVSKSFTVEAEDGSKQVYNVVVKVADDISNSIQSFKIGDVDGVFGGIDGKTITLTLPFGTVSLDGLLPKIVSDGMVTAPGLSDGLVSFVSGVAKPFTVTAASGAKNVYNVVVKTADMTSAVIKSLKIGDVEGVFSGVAQQIITVTLPVGTALMNLVPSIISDGMVTPPTNVNGAIDFISGVAKKFMVKAPDGTTKVYDVIVKTAAPAAAVIKSLKIGDVEGVFSGASNEIITLTMPFGTALTNLVPTIIGDGTVTPPGGTPGGGGGTPGGGGLPGGGTFDPMTFIQGVAQKFTVTAQDGTTKVYDVIVNTAPSASALIKQLKIGDVPGVISGAAGEIITVTMPFGTALTKLVPTIISDGTVTPPPASVNGAIDFIKGQAQKFTVTAQDGTKKIYDVIVNLADPGSALIKSLKIGNIEGVFSGVSQEIITLTMPFGAGLTKLVPSIISDGTVTPPSNLDGAIDFISGVAQKFMVKAGDGSTKVYDVVVKTAAASAASIQSFKIGDVQGQFSGAADDVITVLMPFGSSLMALVPKIVSEGTVTANGLVGGAISFVNGVGQQFTATANDGTMKLYTVVVETSGEAANLIHELKIGDVPGVFSGLANDIITVTLPYGASLLNLAPKIVNDGVVTASGLANGKISFVNGVAQDFQVTAADGTKQLYHVIVNTSENAANLIKELDIGGVPGVFSGVANDIITVTLPFATSLLNLVPNIVNDGTVTAAGFVNGKISFVNGVGQDLTVTAANGQTKTYELIVKTAADASNLIHQLDIGGVPGVFSGLANDIITVTLPFGTSLLNLAPNIVNDGAVAASGLVNGKIDFVNGLAQKLTVTANNGDTKDYSLIVKNALDGANNIKSLDFGDVKGVFSGANDNIITATLPYGTSLLNLVPSIVSDGTVTAPGLVNGAIGFLSGVAKPFTVTAANGDTKMYEVIVKNALDGANAIKSFKLGGIEGVFSGANLDTITTTLPFNSSLLGLSPDIVSDGTVTAPGLIDGLTSFVSGVGKPFTVTAANGDTKVYNVVVNTAANSANTIQSFKIGGFDGVFSGVNMDAITTTLPFGTIPSGLRPVIANSGTITAPGFLDGLIDFIPGQAKPFTVEAANGDKKTYAVTVLVESLQQANEIKMFSLLGQPAEINEPLHTLTVAFDKHRDLSNVLVPPTIVSSAANVLQSLGTKDYTKPVAFTATSLNGTPQVYPLTIINPPAP